MAALAPGRKRGARPRLAAGAKRRFERNDVAIHNDDVLNLYRRWPSPTVIVSDGPYGLDSYKGDLPSADGLDSFYEPHARAWSRAAKPSTTLWFWNSELGWATVHPLLSGLGWKFVNCHVWNKGISHVAGNTNTSTLRKFPVVTEVCVQYVREPQVGGTAMRDWLRSEWRRTGLPLSRANGACGVRNAATRKYLTRDRLWYFPPPDAFVKLAAYANGHGGAGGRPYFASASGRPFTRDEWGAMRAKFRCSAGITNVWEEPAVHGRERLRGTPGGGRASAHPNQKPLKIMQMIIDASSDPGDVVWEPFGGLCGGAVAALRSGRRCRSAEVDGIFYQRSVERLASECAES